VGALNFRIASSVIHKMRKFILTISVFACVWVLMIQRLFAQPPPPGGVPIDGGYVIVLLIAIGAKKIWDSERKN